MLTRLITPALLVAGLLVVPIDMDAQPPAPYREPALVEGDRDAFINRVWLVTASSGVTPGSLYTFLSDGTLVITAGTGTDRPGVGRWTFADTGLVLVEEGRSYRTEILELTTERFRIRVHNPRGSTDITFAPAPHRRDGPGDPGAGSITPVPTSYQCGGQVYKVAFEAGAAYVTLPDGAQVTLPLLAAQGEGQPRTFTNGRLTVTEDRRGARPVVTVARGRMAPITCRPFPSTQP